MTNPNPSAVYFEKNAGQWDSLRSCYFGAAVRDAAIAKAYLHPDMVVADVGAGTGFMADGLAPLVARVHLLDGSPVMLEVARQNLAGQNLAGQNLAGYNLAGQNLADQNLAGQNLASQNLAGYNLDSQAESGQNQAKFSNLEFNHADGLALPLADASLDAVFANMYLHHAPDPLAAIREMVRLLRPGGRLVITDMDAHAHEWMKAEMADVWLGFARQQMRTWFEQAGLVNVIVDCTGESCQSDYRSSDGEPANVNIFVAVGTKRIVAHENVQSSYAARALSGDSCCSDASCCAPGVISLEQIGTVKWDGGYSPADKSAVPQEAAEFSLGCGNPLAMASLLEGETVLDIGSGGGLDAFLAARRVGSTGKVIGVDMTPAMLQRARSAAKKGGFDNVVFKHGYAEKLPVSDASVDVIISNCVINLSEDKGKVFREAYRVLRPNGRLEVNDMVFGGAILPAARSSAVGWSECISGALPEQEYLDLVKQAGFQQVSVRRSTSAGVSGGVPIYSVQVSAVKE